MLTRLTGDEIEVIAEGHTEGLDFIDKADIATTGTDFLNKLTEIEGRIAPIFWNIKLEDKEKLETFCQEVRKNLDHEQLQGRFTAEERKAIEQALSYGNKLLHKEIANASFVEFGKRFNKLEETYKPVMARIMEEDKASLVSYCKQIKSDINDGKFKGRITDEDKQQVESSHDEGLKFAASSGPDSTFSDFQSKR